MEMRRSRSTCSQMALQERPCERWSVLRKFICTKAKRRQSRLRLPRVNLAWLHLMAAGACSLATTNSISAVANLPMMLEFSCPFASKVPVLLSHRDRRRLSTEVVANGCLSTPIASLALSSFCRFTNFASDGYVTAYGTADQRSGEAHVFILKVAKVVELGLLLVENT